MTEAEIRAFLSQFDKARDDFGTWPKWMQEAARTAAATFPHGVRDHYEPCEKHGLRLCSQCPTGVKGPEHG